MKPWLKTLLVTLVIAGVMVLLALYCTGCKAFYENAGSHTRVGSLTAPVEVSEPSDSLVVRALYSMDGADVYTAKDSLVKITYCNSYSNDYFAIVKTHGKQDLSVEIEPLSEPPTPDAPTNTVISVEKTE